LTRHFDDHSISPESSDGFASVGTILPKEEAALLPGGLFTFWSKLPIEYVEHVTDGGVFTLEKRHPYTRKVDEWSVG
jgi:hypothetical protein